MPSPPISWTLLTKDCPAATAAAVMSVKERALRPQDEIVIVDTGSSSTNWNELTELLQDIPNVRYIDGKACTEDFSDKIHRYLGEAALKEFTDYRGDAICIKDFAAARQLALEAAKGPLIAWIDADDELREEIPGQFRRVLDSVFDPDNPQHLEALMMDYLYAFADDGECITTLKRERVFWKDKFVWVGRCHETAIPRPGAAVRQVGFFTDVGARFVHTAARSPHRISDIRNYCILRNEYEEMLRGDLAFDPRTIFYLGNSARGLDRLAEAHELYARFDGVTGSKEDRYNASYYRAAMYLDPRVARPLDAIECYQHCMRVNPKDPRSHFGLARCYAILQRWEESRKWYLRGKEEKLEVPSQCFSFDPTHLTYHPQLLHANVAMEMGLKEEALECAVRAQQIRPNLQQAAENLDLVRFKAAGLYITENVLGYLSTLKNGGPNAKRVGRNMAAEWDFCPPQLEDRGIAKVETPDSRPALPEVVIWCGHSPEEWSWRSAETGIGGSEKMVILLARALQASGRCNVSVYTRVPAAHRGVAPDGVRWQHWAEFDEARPRHALIGWRAPASVMLGVPAKHRILWCHDVPNLSQFSEDVIACADAISVQSEFHASLFGSLTDKLWVTRNAIVPRTPDWSKKNPKRVVFISSPDRGILTAAEIIRSAKAVDPQIEFHVCYGVAPWLRKVLAEHNYRHVPDLGHEVSMDNYELAFCRALDETEAVVHNRIGFEPLRELLDSAGIWLYPTRFSEISCMSAMEAQASGCIPVATRFAALNETILPEARFAPYIETNTKAGIPQVSIRTGKAALLEALKIAGDDPRRKAMSDAANKAFDVAPLAEIWLQRLGL